MSKYITGIQALNYHFYDWHTSYFNFDEAIYENADELREWLGEFGIENDIANPYRAFLDYLYNYIHFTKAVPNYRIEMLLFDDKETQILLDMIDKYLKPKLNEEELKLLEKWKIYNNGGEYDFTSPKSTERKNRRAKNKALREYGNSTDKLNARDLYNIAYILDNFYNKINQEILSKYYDLFRKRDIIDILIDYENAFIEDESLNHKDLFLTGQRLESFKKKMKKCNKEIKR